VGTDPKEVLDKISKIQLNHDKQLKRLNKMSAKTERNDAIATVRVDEDGGQIQVSEMLSSNTE
jgi:3-dehydroquinate dehydratase